MKTQKYIELTAKDSTKRILEYSRKALKWAKSLNYTVTVFNMSI